MDESACEQTNEKELKIVEFLFTQMKYGKFQAKKKLIKVFCSKIRQEKSEKEQLE